MNKLTRRLLTASAVLCVAGASTFALARGGNCDGMADGMGQGPRAEQMQGKMAERMKQRMAQRQADLKAKLKLTPEQEGAWTQFTTAMQPPAQGPKRPDPAEMAKLTTPQRMEKMQAMKAERDAEMTKRMDAVKAFYTTLTPEQQKVFDAEHARMGHGGHSGHHGPMMGRQG
jgi:Spy/CpxP family protein refolding chaperone